MGFKGDSFYTWSACGFDMRPPPFGDAIGGGYRSPTQIGVSYRKCQLFFPIFIKKNKMMEAWRAPYFFANCDKTNSKILSRRKAIWISYTLNDRICPYIGALLYRGYTPWGTTEGVPQKGYHAFFSIKPDKRDSARDLCGNCEDRGSWKGMGVRWCIMASALKSKESRGKQKG